MDILKLNDNCRVQLIMNKYINRPIAGLVFITAIFFSGCNSMYFKTDISPPLKKVEVNYTEIYQFGIPARIKINFIRNGRAIAISSVEGVKFIDLEKNRLIKEIKSPDGEIGHADSDEKGDRYVLLAGYDAEVFNTWGWKLINRIRMDKSSDNVVISKDGTLLYYSNSLWNVDTGEKVVDYVDGMPPTDYAFSDNNRYFIQSALRDSPSLTDINAGKRLDTYALLYIEDSRQVLFRDNTSYYIDYGTLGLLYPETLGLFDITLKRLAEITPYQSISCWARLKNDKRLIMGLVDGDVLVLDEKLKVLDHWSLGSKVLKCTGGENGRAWLATESKGLFEININKKTIANPVALEGDVQNMVIAQKGKYIALVGDVDMISGNIVVRVYLINGITSAHP